MTTKSWSVCCVLLTLLAFIASALAFWFGVQQGSSTVMDTVIFKDARFIESQIQALESLRENESEQAIEQLESSLDDQLVLFDPANPYTGLSDKSLAAMDNAIKQASAYRKRYPRQSDRPHVDKIIKGMTQ